MYETQTGAIRLPAPPNGDRAVARGARGHFSGALVIGEDEGRVVEFESRTERNVALVMIARPDVVALESQVAFHWAAEDGRRAYLGHLVPTERPPPPVRREPEAEPAAPLQRPVKARAYVEAFGA